MNFKPVSIPLVKHSVPSLFANKIVGVQAMGASAGFSYAMKTVFNYADLPRWYSFEFKFKLHYHNNFNKDDNNQYLIINKARKEFKEFIDNEFFDMWEYNSELTAIEMIRNYIDFKFHNDKTWLILNINNPSFEKYIRDYLTQ